jgi:IS30 family transposase
VAKHINYQERFMIERMLKGGYKIKEIAVCLCRSYSAIKREIRRCDPGLYGAVLAHQDARAKMTRASRFELPDETRKFILNRLEQDKWSPMIISQRLKIEGLKVVSHSFIYSYIKTDKRNGGKLWENLAHPEPYSCARQYKGKITDRQSIHDRPEEVNIRRRIGDFEIDLINSPKNQGASIASILDRTSRYCRLEKTPNKTKEIVGQKIIGGLQDIGLPLHTITSDKGNEFAGHADVANKLNIAYYFADPYASWQRGAIEQLNGLVRRFIPKGTRLEGIDLSYLKEVEWKINNRPREVLGWMSPVEYLEQQGIDLKNARLRV